MASSGFVLLTSTAATSACLPLNKATTAPSSSSKTRRDRRLACKATAGGDDDDLPSRRIDRRDVLLGLTGVGAAATSSNLGLALAAAASSRPRPADCVSVPITAEVLKCVPNKEGYVCAASAKYDPIAVVDFSSLPAPIGMRVRRAAHFDDEYVKKYEEAIRRMKALDDSDPRSFKNQAAIHEAYCDKHYIVMEPGKKEEDYLAFDVHFSSIFAPWHRMYIYFFERILGHLIDDSTFGLPYWNWDAPEGMTLPPMFANECSPLYDANRNPEHVHGFIDLNLGRVEKEKRKPRCDNVGCLIENNLCILHRQMFVNTALEFHGRRFCKVQPDTDANRPYTGSLESGAHTAAHIWLGDPAKKRRDMGDLSTAARDPVFYSNHSNVDRMWHIWATELGHEDLPYQQWRDTSFVFYDETKRPVRIKVSDVLDIGKLGYTYEPQKLEWIDKRPTPCPDLDRSAGGGNKPSNPSFPVRLPEEECVYLTVSRPEAASAGGGSSKAAPEVLVIELTIDPCEFANFYVLVNVPRGQEGKVEPRHSEFAGSFKNVPHGKSGRGMEMLPVSYTFPLQQLVQDLKCGRDRKLDITLVPINCENKGISVCGIAAREPSLGWAMELSMTSLIKDSNSC